MKFSILKILSVLALICIIAVSELRAQDSTKLKFGVGLHNGIIVTSTLAGVNRLVPNLTLSKGSHQIYAGLRPYYPLEYYQRYYNYQLGYRLTFGPNKILFVNLMNQVVPLSLTYDNSRNYSMPFAKYSGEYGAAVMKDINFIHHVQIGYRKLFFREKLEFAISLGPSWTYRFRRITPHFLIDAPPNPRVHGLGGSLSIDLWYYFY